MPETACRAILSDWLCRASRQPRRLVSDVEVHVEEAPALHTPLSSPIESAGRPDRFRGVGLACDQWIGRPKASVGRVGLIGITTITHGVTQEG